MTIYEIDETRPFIASKGMPVQWHTGGCAGEILTSRAVRVNVRGLNFKARSWHIRPSLQALGWDVEGCYRSAYGMCSTDSSVVFPSLQTPLVNALVQVTFPCRS